MKTSSKKTMRGFTLVEMMVCSAIIGLLASIALPSYQSAMNKARRSDALVALMDVHLAQSRFRANNAVYGSLIEIGTRATSPSGHYVLDVPTATPAGFAVLATAAGVQRADAACGVMKLTVDGPTVAYASGHDSRVGNDNDANKRCWMR